MKSPLRVFGATALLLSCLPFAAAAGESVPVAYWSFHDLSGLEVVGAVERFDHGPTAPTFPALPAQNPAIQLGKGKTPGFLVVQGDRPDLKFGQGDSITLTAWVNTATDKGRYAYIVGKGRLSPESDNQNWALRLLGSGGGTSKISFLFRSRSTPDQPGEYHRWTSTQSLARDQWTHVAVRYTFGEPKSLRGFIDGQPVKGRWDMGGPTQRPPVMDEDVVVIGSSQGGLPGNSFFGQLDEISIYRELLPEAVIAEQGRVMSLHPAPNLDALPAEAVLAEVHSNAGRRSGRPRRLNPDPEILSLEAFALVDLPTVYTPEGVRADRQLPLFVRLATKATLPPGDYEMLLRAPGWTQFSVDGEHLAHVESFTLPRNGHNRLQPRLSDDEPSLPRQPIGNRETRFLYRSDGKEALFLCESYLGTPGIRFTVNPLVVAYRPEGTPAHWTLLGTQAVPFGPTEFDAYERRQQSAMRQLSHERRQAARAQTAVKWRARHDAARRYLETQPSIPIPEGHPHLSAIDRFLQAKSAPQKVAEEAPPERKPLPRQAWALLESQCVRCHGEKAKGGLDLRERPSALAGGDSGAPTLVPHAPERGTLFQRLRSDDSDERMPPKGKGLTPDEIALLADWVAQGAHWPTKRTPTDLPPPAKPLEQLRRLYLDTVGSLPPPDLARDLQEGISRPRWTELVDQLLDDPRHADHWVSYWQDVLAENPRLVKGKLNNTGPFRWWIHDSLLDNLPFDQFVTELVTFAGSVHGGGAAGFGLATENDVPMAAKAHVIGTAFLGVEMKCARCHDAPYHKSTQRDLFSIAAMLDEEALSLPESSSVPASFFENKEGREPLIEVTLAPGTTVNAEWPFTKHAQGEAPRKRLAEEITHPANPRFAQVIVNRLWKRYFGEGIVEPVHDWEQQAPSHPELLEYLAREFVRSGYDLRHVHWLILTSEAYRREAQWDPSPNPEERFFSAPLRRRVSAEQLVDSLFDATGIPHFSEELSFDPEGAHPPDVMQSLGTPERAWHYNAVSSERDRPSLTLPKASSVLAVLEAFGWRSNRAEPLEQREEAPHALQPGMLGNGILGLWLTRLSDYNDLTQLALHASDPAELVEELYLRFLTRLPTAAERRAMESLLEPGFASRVTLPHESPHSPKRLYLRQEPVVSWASHLTPKANRIAAANEARAAEGPPPTEALHPEWRERMEDVVWALINSPEMQYIP